MTFQVTEFVKLWGGVAGFIALIEFLFPRLKERSNLELIHLKDATKEPFVRSVDSPTADTELATMAPIIATKSSRPNAILRYRAWVKDRDGNDVELDTLRGELTSKEQFNVVPLTLPPYSAVEAHFVFQIRAPALPDPEVSR